MKTLLIYPSDRDFMPPSMPPLGLAYVASALTEDGHSVDIIDLNGDRNSGLFRLKESLSTGSYEMIGISSIITQYGKVKDLCRIIKSIVPHTPLVLGGPGPTSIPHIYMRNCSADIICIGEGEKTVKELAFCIQENRPLDYCKGIVYRKVTGDIAFTAPREQISNIDEIRFPAWDLMENMNIYAENYLFKNERENGMTILSSRGCPGRCNYCMCNFGRKIRTRSAENIFSEIDMLVKKYNIKHIHFVDDTFVARPSRIKRICDLFINEFGSLTWSANARVNIVTPEMLRYMAKANCTSLAYGIESGSPAVLKYMKKGITLEQAKNAINWTRKAAISLTTYFIIGMPCETPQTMRETIDFCKENLVGGEFFFATPIPGSELYQVALEKKIINNEDLYLEHIGEVRNFLVNMTDMSNEELFDLKEKAETEIKEHLKGHNIVCKTSIREDPRVTSKALPKF